MAMGILGSDGLCGFYDDDWCFDLGVGSMSDRELEALTEIQRVVTRYYSGKIEPASVAIREISDLLTNELEAALTEPPATPVAEATLRPPLAVFASRMEAVLKKNDYKGGWHNMTPDEILERIDDEISELRWAVKSTPYSELMRDEAADVANFCMMLSDLRIPQPAEAGEGSL